MALLKALVVGFMAFLIIALNTSSNGGALVGAIVAAIVAYVYFRGMANVARNRQ